METEIWKVIPNYEKYEVSNFGNVKSLSRDVKNRWNVRIVKETLMKSILRPDGYYSINLRKNGCPKSFLIHQLVAICFLNHKPNRLELVINHKDFNKQNNNINNLEIITQRENTNLKHLKSSSKYTGVTWNKKSNKWQSQIIINGKCKYLGLFLNENDASKKYLEELKNL